MSKELTVLEAELKTYKAMSDTLRERNRELVEALQEIAPAQTDVVVLRALALAALNGSLLGNQKECVAQSLQDYARFIRIARAALARGAE